MNTTPRQRFFLMIHGDATFGVPNGDQMETFAFRLADDPAGLKREASGISYSHYGRFPYGRDGARPSSARKTASFAHGGTTSVSSVLG